MKNPWFRMYGDFINNPKVQIVTEALRYRYVALLCLHCNGDYENRPNDEIALSLRVTVEEWILTRDEFVRRELLTPDFKIYGWEKKQYISDIKDSTAAIRQKRYRENKRNPRNEAVTSRLPEADTDTEADTERVINKACEEKTEFQKIFEAGCEIFPGLVTANSSPIHQWIASGCDPGLDAIPEIKRQSGKPINAWAYFTNGVMNAQATRTTPAPKGKPNGKPGKFSEQNYHEGTEGFVLP